MSMPELQHAQAHDFALPKDPPDPLPPAVFARIEQEMAIWAAELQAGVAGSDSFRYTMLSRRVMAAERGRPDAVTWVWDWYRGLVVSDQEQHIQDQQQVMETGQRDELRRQQLREEIARGQAGNPRFQAFLDTLEDPQAELFDLHGSFKGWKYIVWLSPLVAAFSARKELPRDEQTRQDLLTAEVQAYAHEHRAPRLREASEVAERPRG